MIDRLIEAVTEKKNPTVVGLDPVMDMMPEQLKNKYLKSGKDEFLHRISDMFLEFNMEIIDALKDIVPAVKPQVAMYEKYGIYGIYAYDETCRYAAEQGLIVIGDIKRGDISSTAACYAGHLSGVEFNDGFIDTWREDAVTVNPYMGSDGIIPFISAASERDKGIFVLLKTSNPGSRDIQDLQLADGRKVYEAVADLIDEWGRTTIGKYGYSKVGAVVGATHRHDGEKLRKNMPHTFFLVPGYGAQGGGAEDIAGFFDNERSGAIISSSRGITSAWKKYSDGKELKYADAAREAAEKMREDIISKI